MSIEEIADEILRETAALRARYRDEFRGDGEGELLAWLELAVRREAMVCFLYARAQRDRRLEGPADSAVGVARDALNLIWQQEESHAAMLAARLIDGVFAGRPERGKAIAAKVGGTLEAAVFDLATDPKNGFRRAIAKVAIWFGETFTPSKVPDFAKDMPAANPREFFQFASALEKTARDCYTRVSELLPSIIRTSTSLQPHGLLKPVQDTRLDEVFHQRAFDRMARWTDREGMFNPRLEAVACVRELRTLLVEATGVASLDERGRAPQTGVPEVPTLAGLGPLFERYDVKIKLRNTAAVP